MADWQPMKTVDKNRTVVIKTKDGREVIANFLDCSWLRENLDAGPEIKDCWRPESKDGDDIELDDAVGWK